MLDAGSEVPSHYSQYYLNYEAGALLVQHLASNGAIASRGASTPDTALSIPHNVRRAFDGTLQWMLAGHASQFDGHFLKALVPQVAFRDFLAEEIKRINQFAALRYSEIEQQLRSTCRTLRKLQAYDKRRALRRQTVAEDTSNAAAEGESHNGAPSKPFESRTKASTLSSSVEVSSSDLPDQSCSSSDDDDLNDDNDFSVTTASSWVSTAPNLLGRRTDSPVAGTSTTNSRNSRIRKTHFRLWWERRIKHAEMVLECQEAEIIHLDMFVRVNYKRCIQLCHFFDETINSTVTPWVTASLRRELFTNVDLDRLLIFMSVSWEKWRIVSSRGYLGGQDEDTEKWVPPESFTRQTTKYWIPPGQIVRLKLSILRHMPYLIFGCSFADLERYIDPYCAFDVDDHTSRNASAQYLSKNVAKRPAPSETSSSSASASSPRLSQAVPERCVEEGQLITSIYFDSTVGYSYRQRLLRLEKAELIRFRWYGSNNGESSKPIFVERKTHHESWTGDSSTKERFSLPQKYIPGFMVGSLNIEQYVRDEVERRRSATIQDKKYAHMLSLGKAVQQRIIEHRLQPMVRTSYQRAAFQLATSNEVRFSLDTNLCMVDEFVPWSAKGHDDQRSWCRWGEEILGKDQVVRFPYGILEVKLQTANPPAWVSSILASTGAVMVYKFSKFQHGMAFLHPSFVACHGIPHWIPEFQQRDPAQNPTVRHVPRSLQPKNALPSEPANTHPEGVTFFAIDQQPSDTLVVPFRTGIPLAGPSEGTSHRHSQRSWLTPLRSAVSQTARALTSFTGRPPLPADAGKTGYTLLPSCSSHVSADVKRTLLYGKDRNPSRPPETVSPSSRRSLSPQLSTATPHRYALQRATRQWNLQCTEPFTQMTPEMLRRVVISRSLNIPKIDPKSFFASERTLLHYLQKALYIASLAILLVGYGTTPAMLLGIVLSVFSMALMVFSYSVFSRRCRKIGRRMTKGADLTGETLNLADQWGPLLLFFVIGGGVVIAVIVHFSMPPGTLKAPSPPQRPRADPALGINGTDTASGSQHRLLEGLMTAAHQVLLGVWNTA